jgi:copper transport protein
MFEDSLRNVAFTIVRFSQFVSGAMLFGLVVVALLVLRPSFGDLSGKRFESARLVLGHRIGSLVKASLALSATAAILGLLLQALLVADLGGGRVDSSDFSSVLDSSFGLWHVVRLPFLLALGVLLGGSIRQRVLSGAGDERASPPTVWWTAWAGFALGVLLTNSMAGHAAVSSPAAVAVMNDLVHLAAGAIWFTGIVVLAVVLPEALRRVDGGDRLAVIVPHVVNFSRLALISIAVIGLTGTINLLFNLESPSDLFDSGYGRALSVKLALFAGILLMGGINHVYVRNRLAAALERQDRSGAGGVFRKTIAVELSLGIVLLVITGVLVGSARTRQVSGLEAPPQRESPHQAGDGGDKEHKHEAHLGAHTVG